MTLTERDVEADEWLDGLTVEDRELVRLVETTPACEVTVEDRRRYEHLRYGETS